MPSELILPESSHESSPAQPPFQILCLSGGGYRGLYTATLLEELEKQSVKPLAQVFDLIAGTSIGGILALGLAAGIKAKTLRESFEKKGSAIFPSWIKVAGLKVLPRFGIGAVRSKYNVDGLRETIEAIFASAGSVKTLHDLQAEVLIPSVDVTNSAPRLFGLDKRFLSVPLLDVALATSAAPTYFPEHLFDKNIFVDGGLIANAPDVIALVHALKTHSLEHIQMLSLGTVGGAGGEAARKPNRRGFLLTGKKLVDLTLNAQEKLSIEVTANLLDKNYIRLDANPSAKQLKAIGLDKTGKKASDTLVVLAQNTVAEGFARHKGKLQTMLNRTASRHRPSTP